MNDSQSHGGFQGRIKSIYQKYWERHPFMAKFLIGMAIIFYLINMFTDNILANSLSNNIEDTLYQAQLWRIVTQSYVHKGIFELLICIMLVYFDASALERIIGSGTFFLYFSLKNMLISLNNISIAYLLYLATGFDFFRANCCSTGYWPAIISDIIIRSFTLPMDKRDNILILPIQISNKMYAIVIVSLVFLIYCPALELIAAFIFVYIEYNYFNGMILRIKKKTVKSVEKFACCLFMKRQDFVEVDACSDTLFKPDSEDGLANLDENLDQNDMFKKEGKQLNYPADKLQDEQPYIIQQVQLEIKHESSKNSLAAGHSSSDTSDQEQHNQQQL